MNMIIQCTPRLLRAADNLVRDSFAVRPGEGVLITADTRTETALLDAVVASVLRAGAQPVVTLCPVLPYQGGLSDPFVPDALRAAMAAADVWLDLCFPYHAGSTGHSAAIAAKRCRYGLVAIGSTASLERIYGCVDFPALMDFNIALAEFVRDAVGEAVRFTCPRGSDLRFELDAMKLVRPRSAVEPGIYTVPGTQSLYPKPGTTRGRIVIQALFDEYYRALRLPITIEAEGRITRLAGGAAEDRSSFHRALIRAGGEAGGYGGFVHFTCGFHPGTMMTGQQFIEDIRVPGTNAIGMGLPWWEPGGGENHPDGIVFDQSLWIGDIRLMDEGVFVGPEPLARLHAAMTRRLD